MLAGYVGQEARLSVPSGQLAELGPAILTSPLLILVSGKDVKSKSNLYSSEVKVSVLLSSTFNQVFLVHFVHCNCEILRLA